MGTQFYWFYDIVIIAIFIGVTFRCYRKGFVSSLIGLLTVVVAFVVSLLLSGVIAQAVYDSFIREPAEDYINEKVEQIADINTLTMLPNVDATMIIIKGVPLTEMEIIPDAVGNIDLDLTEVDLSQTGIETLNIAFFGITAEDLTSINAGKAVITSAELAESEFETLVLAKILSNTLQDSADFWLIEGAAQIIEEFFPQLSGTLSGGVSDNVSGVIVAVIEADGTNVTDAVLDNLFSPVILLPLRALIFFLIFVIISLVLSFASKAFTFVNRVPVIGTVNSLLGIAVGIIIAAVIVFLVCILVKILISLTGNSVIFLNTMTIEQTYIFKHFYNFNLL